MRPFLQSFIASLLSPLFDEDFGFLRGLTVALSPPNKLGSFVHVLSDFEDTEGAPRPQQGGSITTEYVEYKDEEIQISKWVHDITHLR